MEEEKLVTLENIAPSKLLNYVSKDKLIEFITPAQFAELGYRLRQQLNKTSVNRKDIKKHLATRADFVQSLRRNPIGAEAFQKYLQAAERMRNIDRTQAIAVRKTMSTPRRQFQGCLATRLQPADYEHCLDNYNNEEFEKLKLVPTRLKERVYENGDPTIKVMSARSFSNALSFINSS